MADQIPVWLQTAVANLKMAAVLPDTPKNAELRARADELLVLVIETRIAMKENETLRGFTSSLLTSRSK